MKHRMRGVGKDVTSWCRTGQATVGEQPRALADDNGEGEQCDLVDKVVVELPEITRYRVQPDVAWKRVRLEGYGMNVAFPVTLGARAGRSFGNDPGMPEHTP
jgi:hypothetical protein